MNLGLGCMRPRPEDFQQLVDYAMTHNITYFEACQFYQKGQCEQIVGEALKKYPRESYQLCGKINFPYRPNIPIDQVFNDSLKNCQVDYFDYYLIQAVDRHSLVNLTPENISFLNQMKQAGKIKHLGFSFHDTPEYFQQVLDLNNWDCCQLQINYYDWHYGVAKDLYEIAESRNIPIIVMGGLKGGTLTERLPQVLKDSYRQSRPNDTLAALGYRFLKQFPMIKIILSGAFSVPMLAENLENINSDIPFSNIDQKFIERILSVYSNYNTIQCTNCKYCESVCPKSIPLGEFFTLYNKIITNSDDIQSRESYYLLLKDMPHSFLSCIKCNRCQAKCPQHLPIQQLINNNLFPLRL